MSRQLHMNEAAEREADEIALRFTSSSDVVADMSRAYGADLSSVRIHTDEGAAQKVEGTGADAFSTGKDIFFGRGVFDQGNPAGRGLLAHELAHSLQQGIGNPEPGAVEHPAPEGAAQGGRLTDWFRGVFRRKKQPKDIENRIRERAPSAWMESKHLEDTLEINDKMRTFLSDQNNKENLNHKLSGIDKTKDKWNKLDEVLSQTKRDDRGNTIGTLMDIAEDHSLNSGWFSADTESYLRALTEGGVDFTGIMENLKQSTLNVGDGDETFAYGNRLGQISGDFLKMIGDGATGKAGTEYFRNWSDMMQNLDMFNGDRHSALNYLMRQYIQRAGGVASARAGGVGDEWNRWNQREDIADAMAKNGVKDAEGQLRRDFDEGGAESTVKAAFDLLEKLPELDSLSKKDQGKLPGPVRALLEQYKEILKAIEGK